MGLTEREESESMKTQMGQIDKEELQTRIKKNLQRLKEPYYQIGEVFADESYDWPGDKEGRALLAFVCHYRMHGEKIPCMEAMIEELPRRTNDFFYFGRINTETIDEQQLSGHSWYLRGLLAYYDQFGNERVLEYAKSTVAHLYLPTRGRFDGYPVQRDEKDGEVSGHSTGEQDGWILSSDVGCAFMSIDGLAHYYRVTKDENVLMLLNEMRIKFDSIDKMQIRAQTHCCLTAARGFLLIYRETGDENYLRSATEVANLYLQKGMTLTYQNYNWWNKGNTWTEPCAIVDSLIVMTELYKITGDSNYRTIAARIYHNGLSTAQVGNGGAGTNTTVNGSEPILKTLMYEAYFCCTMRLAEGLLYIQENQELLYAETGELHKDACGRYMAGDILYAEVHVAKEFERMTEDTETVSRDGRKLRPIIKYYDLPKKVTDTIEQRIVF